MSHISEVIAQREHLSSEVDAIMAAHPAGEYPPEVQQRLTEIRAKADQLTEREKTIALREELRQRPGRALSNTEKAPDSGLRVFSNAPAHVPEGFDGVFWRTADGGRTPVLEPRHALTAFHAPEASAAGELGLAGFFRCLVRGTQTDLEKRAMAEATIGVGGALVPTVLATEILELARPMTAIVAAGARTVPMPTATVNYARQIADPEGAWRAENTDVAVSQPVFEQVQLVAQSFAVDVPVSQELLEDASNLNPALNSILARAGAVAWDQAALYGTGHTDHMPLGVANTPNVLAVSMGDNGAAITDWSAVLSAVGLLEAANSPTITAMIASPRTALVLYSMQDTLRQPLRRVDRIANVPLYVTSSVPINESKGSARNASSLLIGDFGQVYLGVRTEMRVQVLSELYGAKAQIGFRLWFRGDVLVARPSSLCRISGIIPAS